MANVLRQNEDVKIENGRDVNNDMNKVERRDADANERSLAYVDVQIEDAEGQRISIVDEEGHRHEDSGVLV